MQNDFSQGSVGRHILNMAIPMTLAQLINLLYNVVDRMFIGRMPQDATLSLTGLGVALPIISIVMAFANLFGMGGAPLCSIARGHGDQEEAEAIMGNSFVMLLLSGVLLTAVGLWCKRPLLYLFGASPETFPFADAYLSIYLWGNLFVMVGLGMNSFVNAQGFARVGMATVLLGAVLNILLDPIFIFVLDLGVQGAALATVISQFVSAAWIFAFLTSRHTILRLRLSSMKLSGRRVLRIVSLGLSNFTMSITNGVVQVVCNSTLQAYGGDLYVGVMTVLNSVREIITMPIGGITSAAQPVMSYNYGAQDYSRVKSAIRILTAVGVTYTLAGWAVVNLFPSFFIHIFNDDPQMVQAGVQALRIYFFGFFMMALQFCGQSVFVALGKSKRAIFFSLLRKVFIVVPLTLLLPTLWGLGVNGVFLAEPVSNFIGGGAAFTTMLLTVWPELTRLERAASSAPQPR